MSVGGQNSNWQHGTNSAPTSLTDFSTRTMSVDSPFEVEQVDATTFGNSGWKAYEPGLGGGTFSVEYKGDATLYTQLTDIFKNKTAVNFQHSPDGTTTGKPKVTGQMYMTSVSLPANVGELMTFSTEWNINGAPTFATHA